MATKMIATHRRYTKQQQRSYRARVWRRQVDAEFSHLRALEDLMERVAPQFRQYGEMIADMAPVARVFADRTMADLKMPTSPDRTLEEILGFEPTPAEVTRAALEGEFISHELGVRVWTPALRPGIQSEASLREQLGLSDTETSLNDQLPEGRTD